MGDLQFDSNSDIYLQSFGNLKSFNELTHKRYKTKLKTELIILNVLRLETDVKRFPQNFKTLSHHYQTLIYS